MTDEALTKTQLDKLGERLRAGVPSERDLRALDIYRHSFRPAYDAAMNSLAWLRVTRTGRPEKTPQAIIDKLNRQPIRLSQIQDIAGIRLVCRDVADQDLIVGMVSYLFPGPRIDDRRIKPSHGYRAVHLVVPLGADRVVEIQVRTHAQDRWANVCEKVANLLRDPSIKYGGGPASVRTLLASYAEAVREVEPLERQHHDMEHRAYELRLRTADAASSAEYETLKRSADQLSEDVRIQRTAIEEMLDEIAKTVESSVKSKKGHGEL